MTRFLVHTRAAVRRVLRQQVRQRRAWLAAATAAAVAAPGMPSAATVADVAGTALFGLVLAVTITTLGAPGDDLASGAFTQDLLAGTPTLAVVLGTIGGAAAAAGPAAAAVAALTVMSPVSCRAALGFAAAMATGVVVTAVLAAWVALGTVITGRSAGAITLPLAFVGFLPPQGLPVDDYPAAVADAVRAVWSALPLPHHLAPIVRAVESATPMPWGDVAAVLLGAPIMMGLAVASLYWRMARGRWA